MSNDTIKLESGKTYITQSGIRVTLVRFSTILYYGFQSADPESIIYYEKWAENGKAYHDDCGYNIVSEVV